MTDELKPCPFCGDTMRWVGPETFTHTLAAFDGPEKERCKLRHDDYHISALQWWNTRRWCRNAGTQKCDQPGPGENIGV